MAIHRDLTDPELHEPKGIATALSGQVYIATGTGSGVWGTAVGGTMPVATYDPAGVAEQLVGLTATQTLTNKTINGSLNTITNINLTTAVTGTLPITNGGTGATTAADARTALNVDVAGTDNSTNVTLAGTPNYITIAGQVITRALINLTSHVTGALPATNGGFQRFVSSDQVITSAGSLTIAHGLPTTPIGTRCLLVCQIAENGYNPGDIVDPGQAQGTGGNRGVAIVPDGTNLNIRFGSQGGSSFSVVHRTTGANANITNANWLARFVAFIV